MRRIFDTILALHCFSRVYSGSKNYSYSRPFRWIFVRHSISKHHRQLPFSWLDSAWSLVYLYQFPVRNELPSILDKKEQSDHDYLDVQKIFVQYSYRGISSAICIQSHKATHRSIEKIILNAVGVKRDGSYNVRVLNQSKCGKPQ
jgi:hypothetical protein